MNRFWGLKLATMRKAVDGQIMTPEGREMTGEVLGGLGGMAAGTTLLEGFGKMSPTLAPHGGYGATLMKLLTGGDIPRVGKGMPARIALALLMGLPYGAAMTVGQRLGGRVARTFETPDTDLKSSRR